MSKDERRTEKGNATWFDRSKLFRLRTNGQKFALKDNDGDKIAVKQKRWY
jgi:hypothetical protein